MQDIKLLRKIIDNSEDYYTGFAKQAKEGFDYYNNHGRIKRTGAAAIAEINDYLVNVKGTNPLRSADNRVGLNRHKVVIDQKIGYMFSGPPTFDIPSDDKDLGDKELLKKINDTIGTQWHKVIKQLALDASNTSKGWLTYWIDNDTGKFDYWFVNPLTVRPIYDRSTVKKRLKYLIRSYDYVNEQGNPAIRYEVWDDKEVAYLIKQSPTRENVNPMPVLETLPDGAYNPMPHNYGRIPFIEFKNNAHGGSDLQMYKDIVDAMDKLVSGFANDIDDLQEIVWVIKNYGGETSTTAIGKDNNTVNKPIDLLQMLKAKKWVSVDDKGGLETVQGEIPFEARKTFYELLDKEFWQAGMAVDPSPDKIGNQSGVYISFLYGLLEEKSGLMETEFRESIDEFLKAILHYLGVDETKQFIQTWKRTKPQNLDEIVSALSDTAGTVMSDETKTKVHPLVDDWESERARIVEEQKQKEQNMLDFMSDPDHGNPQSEPNNQNQPNRNDRGTE